MKTLAMAWRNLFRQKRRTLITLSALIIGLCGVVIFQGYIGSLMRGFRDSTIRSGIGHLQIAAVVRLLRGRGVQSLCLRDEGRGTASWRAFGRNRRCGPLSLHGLHRDGGYGREVRDPPDEGIPCGAHVLSPRPGRACRSRGPILTGDADRGSAGRGRTAEPDRAGRDRGPDPGRGARAPSSR